MFNEKKYMLLITFNNKELNSLLYSFKSLFQENNKPSLAHITIRGPFKKRPYKNVKNSIEEFIKNKPIIQVKGSGVFHNKNNCYVVYLKAKCDQLKESGIWSKPDYKDEFNPHVTIYKGKDKDKAYAISNFLEKHNISFDISDYEIKEYVLNEPNTPSVYANIFAQSELIDNRSFSGSKFIVRAEKELANYLTKNSKIKSNKLLKNGLALSGSSH